MQIHDNTIHESQYSKVMEKFVALHLLIFIIQALNEMQWQCLSVLKIIIIIIIAS